MNPDIRARITAKNEASPAFKQVVDDANRAAGAIDRSGKRMAGAMQAANNNVGNLAAQFNDIGVQLAGGQSPFLIALQQGSQISQAIGPMGAGGAVKALGSAFLSLLSPINLLTIGVIGVGGAALQWLLNVNSEGPKAEEVLKAHEAWLSKILKGYEDVQKGAGKYYDDLAKLPQGVVSAEVSRSLEGQRDLIASQADMVAQLNERLTDYVALLSQSNDLLTSQLGIGPEDLDRLRQFVSETDQLNVSSTTSLDTLGALMTTTSQLMNTIDDPAVDQFLQDIYNWADGLRMARAESARLAAIIGSLSFPAVPASFTNALEALGRLAPTKLSDREQALAALNAGLGSAQDEIQRAALRKEYEATIARITAAESIASPKGGASAVTSLPKVAEGLDLVDDALLETAKNSQQLANTIAGSLSTAASGFFSTVLKGGDAVAALTTQLGNLADQLLNSAINSFFSSIVGSLLGNPFGSLGNDVGTGSTFGGVQAFLRSANGNVVSGAGISAYSGSIVSRPTLFPFASGVGLMGEAGPEAILPLRRGAGGRLGVETSGGGGGGITQIFNIDAKGAEIGVEEKIVRAIQSIVPGMIDNRAPAAVAKTQRNRGM